MNLALVFKQSKSNAVDRGIAPALVEETTSSIKMVEVVLVRLAAKEVHVRDLEITPEMTCRVALRSFVMCWSALIVCEPLNSAVLVQVIRMVGKKLDGFGPQGRQGLGFVVESNSEAIGLVVVLHVAEDIVIDVAKEVDFRFNAPVPSHILQGRMLIENAAIPSTHLMIRNHLGVLYTALFEDRCGLVVKGLVNPGGSCPMFLGNQF